MRYFILYTSILAFSLTIAACNVFDGLYEEGASSDPEVLLSDGRTAIQDGRIDDAVAHLTKAHDKQPANIEIRVELASALLAQHKIDVMLISDLADDIGAESGASSKQGGCTDERSCHFDCFAAKSATPFSYRDSDAYLRLEETLDVLEQVDNLVGAPLEELGAVPGRRFDSEEARQDLFEALVAKIQQTHSTEDARAIAASLLLNAGITKLSTTLADLERSADEHDITLYHVERADGVEYVSYCGENVDMFVTGTMCLATSSANFTMDLLETRLENFSTGSAETTSMAAELVDAGHELFDGMSEEVDGRCDG